MEALDTTMQSLADGQVLIHHPPPARAARTRTLAPAHRRHSGVPGAVVGQRVGHLCSIFSHSFRSSFFAATRNSSSSALS